MCILFSPVDFLEYEYVMDIIDFRHEFDLSHYENAERIFDNTNNGSSLN